jgi:argininosuccinate lyase
MTIIRGRFQKAADKEANRYTASIPFDHRLYTYDIAGSMAHARMLARQGIITSIEAGIIVAGLADI